MPTVFGLVIAGPNLHVPSMKNLRLQGFLLLFLAGTSAIHAELIPAPLFQDGAILQHGKPITIWGTATPGEPVTVTLQDQSYPVTANEKGNWKVEVAPLAPSHQPITFLIADTQTTLTYKDVLAGDVWLASGQSNMEWSVQETKDAAIEIAAANFPAVREIKIEHVVSETPLHSAKGIWRTATPENVSGFSAAAYFFARDIHALQAIPIGIINITWGGTAIESWMTPEALAEPEFSRTHKHWAKLLADYPLQLAKYQTDLIRWEMDHSAAVSDNLPVLPLKPAPPKGPGHPATPSGLFLGMIKPVVPYGIRGFLWYQGESNAGGHAQYHAQFSRLITDWRGEFAQGDLPFYWVQLSSYTGTTNYRDDTWGYLREAQTQTLKLPVTGQALSYDIGDVADIHPRNKQDVGRRLARLALARTYGQEIMDRGPEILRVETAGLGPLQLYFDYIGETLRSPTGNVSGFDLAGEDGVFHPAEAWIEEEGTVRVQCKEVPTPAAIRYAWTNATDANLLNSDMLPALPFQVTAESEIWQTTPGNIATSSATPSKE